MSSSGGDNVMLAAEAGEISLVVSGDLVGARDQGWDHDTQGTQSLLVLAQDPAGQATGPESPLASAPCPLPPRVCQRQAPTGLSRQRGGPGGVQWTQ